ncbi:MAG: hypothetical protein ACREDE_10615 [Thermoplasmata archaeon]
MPEPGPVVVGSPRTTLVPAVALAAVVASGETPLQLTTPLVWVMLALTVAGAIITYAFLVYSVWRFRDPAMKGRRHG